ncbi:hypothetical protein L916_00289 [Phytophthora nicotianae]|uniref:Uncharacterized protein n=1 Tax=Phytophthora nicotianae TaxID=4792 RepID=W2JXS4_PHYNI|nr:hypothetical protein L916_00289 [Phytophthora nicotianae]
MCATFHFICERENSSLGPRVAEEAVDLASLLDVANESRALKVNRCMLVSPPARA